MSLSRSPLENSNTFFELEPQEVSIVQTLREHGELSRTDLADLTGFSRAKITHVVGGLVDRHIIAEVGEGESSGGRRPRLLTFNSEFGYVVGVDMGATSLDIALADFNGHILERHYELADVREGAERILSRVTAIISDQIAKHGISPERIYGVGIGVPGPVEFSKGVLIVPPIMPGWEAYPIREFIRNAFPYATVIVDNDVNVMALGEQRAGAGVGVENFLFVKVGTGIGCGIVAQGHIYRGSSGCAGDIGHITADRNGPVCHCGNIGCLEAVAAGPPMAAKAMAAAKAGNSAILSRLMDAHEQQLTAEDVGIAAQQGDRAALEIIQDSGRIIGEVLAGLVNFFNPNVIVIGGGVSKIGGQFLVAIRRAVLHRSTPLSTRHLRIDYSEINEDVGVIGAIALTLEHQFVEKQ